MSTVLFVCLHNAGRSQMSEPCLTRPPPAATAPCLPAPHPASVSTPEVVEVMREIGIDLADRTPQLLTRELATLIAPWLNETGQTAFYHQIADFDEAYLEEIQRGCAAIDIPVQILWGEQDDWIPAEYGRRLAKLIPGAGFELIPGAGHLVQHDAPVVLADRIRRWLTDGQVTATPR
jgi:pimeloyl-ACP methyl ester carboxylesterase